MNIFLCNILTFLLRSINIIVANAISLDCDCDAHQGDPVIADIGIVASLDPVANDQAFIDFIWKTI